MTIPTSATVVLRCSSDPSFGFFERVAGYFPCPSKSFANSP